ncbi:hypothetical protein EBR04_07930 [bacterium]|nr:hypothetical protein [bacterium]
MADEKTRVLTAAEAAGLLVEPPRFVKGKIVFFCPNGHRLVVAEVHAGKRGRCDKAGCGVAVVIPARPPMTQDAAGGVAEAADEPAPAAAVPDEHAEPSDAADAAVISATVSAGDQEATAEPGGDEAASEPADDAAGQPQAGGQTGGQGDWQFTVAGEHADADADAGAAPDAAPPAASWGGFEAAETDGEAFDNPTARLVARLWVERDHGGVVELHLTGGSVILPEWYESRWSRGTHGLFASQAADGSITLTAVAWEAIQKVVVRQVQGLPDGMFE